MSDSNNSGCRCNYIKGINCSVKNCVYHDGETHCTAGQIAVSNSHAECSSETACETFKPHDCCKG